VQKLRPGSDDEASYGPMTMASQTGIVRRHIEDAAASGARVVRGDADPSLFPSENYLAPTVLLDVPESSAAVREETFGPTLTITKVRDARRRSSSPTRARTGWPVPSSPSPRTRRWTSPAGCAAA
jgi:acyl-CoA reductase-like NAD-dependent aldehyde dehydrogenase